MKKRVVAEKQDRTARQTPKPPAATVATSVVSPCISQHERQGDQPPSPCPDDPWVKLHPERIWPD